MFMKIYILTFFVVLCQSVFSQLLISNQGATAGTIVQGFIGDGLTISNPVISCPTNAYGTFSNGNTTSLGITNGILLTTGNVVQVSGAAGTQNGSPNMNTNNHTWCEDVDILAIEAAADNDCCFLDFDVTPQCNQLTIRFVFGSEEYPEYVSSTFNDAFGFFVSGQNPLGGNYSNTNIATLPNNSTIVSINNINATTNTAYYINNSSSTSIAFDGLTKVISRTIDVVPCQSYHFKLGIADAIDHGYDSGVFIDFLQCAAPLSVSTTTTNATCSLNNGSATAITTGGIGALSYNWVPTPGGGQGSPTVTGLIPGQTYTVTIDDNYACIPAQSSTVIVTGSLTPTLTLNNTTICSGSNAIITAIPSAQGGSYLWNTGDTTSSITVSPSTTTTYSCIYTLNGCSSTEATSEVTVNPLPILTVTNAIVCEGDVATIIATPFSNGVYQFNWLVPNGAISPGNASIVNSTVSGAYIVTITDLETLCTSNNETGILTIIPIPEASISSLSKVCFGNSTIVNFNGTANSILSYSINNNPSQTILLNAQGIGSVSTGVLTNVTTFHLENISIIETPFCSKVIDTIINIEVEELPLIDFSSDLIKGCSPLTVNFTNESVNSSNCLWDFGDGTNSNNCGLVSHTFNAEGCYDIKLKLTSINGCTSELIKSDMICVYPTPKAIFEPNPNLLSSLNSLSLMQNSSVNADYYNWIFGDGSTSLEFNPEHNYILDDGISEYRIRLIAISDLGCRDTTEATIKVLQDLIYYIPNAFTPDGDKFNQTFHPIFTKGFDPYNYNMTIINRWGEILFESNDSDIGWDGSYNGKVVQDGVYTWIINFKLKTSDDKKSIKGHVNLLR